MNRPFFSLAVITYQSGATIGETLECLQRLEGMSDIELVFVDDGSTDQTVALVKTWLERNSSSFFGVVTRFDRQNRGISESHQSAFRASSGLWGTYLGGDDLIVNPWLFVQLKERLLVPSECFYRLRVQEYWSDEGRLVDLTDSFRFMLKLSAERQFRYLACSGNPFRSGPGSVFRVDTLNLIDGFGGYHRAYEDWQLFLRFTRAGHRIGFLPLSGVWWRRHSRATTATGQQAIKVADRVVKRIEIVPYLSRLSLFERWKYRYTGKGQRRISDLYQKFLLCLGAIFHG
jgi:glycosyltransferase involved in cell wall biosynthesis